MRSARIAPLLRTRPNDHAPDPVDRFAVCDDGALHLGKIRYDVTAMLALLAALALGIVKPEEAFSGFSDDIVIIVGSRWSSRRRFSGLG